MNEDIKRKIQSLNSDELDILIKIIDGEPFVKNIIKFGSSQSIENKTDLIAKKLADLGLIDEQIQEYVEDIKTHIIRKLNPEYKDDIEEIIRKIRVQVASQMF